MRNFGILALVILLASCGGPSLPVPVADIKPVADTLKVSITEDTIPTIVITNPEPGLYVEIQDSVVSITEGKFAYNNETGVDNINLVIENGKISYLLVDGEQLVNSAKQTVKGPPCELLRDGRVRVKDGATLTFIARYYGVSTRRLIRCNSWIDNQDYIQSGEILTLNCPCNLCDD